MFDFDKMREDHPEEMSCQCGNEEKMKEYREALERCQKQGFVKMEIPLANGSVETPWCKVEDEGLLKVANVTYFTTACCIDDIVEAEYVGNNRFRFVRTVERMTEAVYFAYQTDGMTKDEIRKRYKLFVNACQEHDFKAEAPIYGYVVVAVPYGEVEESVQKILDYAKTAELKMEVY